MLYLSTRGHPDRKHFCDILLEGLAPDGGLYLPEHYPQIDDAKLTQLRKAYHEQGYAELAFQILSLYIDDIPAADLKALCAKTYTAEVFGTGEIVPLRHLEDGLWLEALSNGPTLAFKDMAMQLLGNLFEYELKRRGEQLNILGATSGDTGSAAEYAMRGKEGVRVFMTSPHGRMSAFQQAQMFSLQDENIHNIAIEGVFDDCQDIVKAVSNDLEFKRKYKIGTVNSINWARLLAQVVYYFAGYIQATEHPAPTLGTGVSSLPPEGAQSPRGGSSAIGRTRADLEISPNLWAGVGLVRGGAGTALVGDPQTVAARIEEYAALGLDTFVLSGYPHLEEAYRFAELVFPLLPLKLRDKLAGGNPLGPFGETVANDFVPRASQS